MDAAGLIESFGGPLVVTRPAQGQFVDGDWIPGDPAGQDQFTITASVQPLAFSETVLIPDGQRNRDAVKVYTVTELHEARPSEQQKGDLLYIGPDVYEVFKVAAYPLPPAPLSHYKVIALKQPKDS